MAVDAHVRYLRSGRARNAVAATGWLLAAMVASEKGAVVPLLLFGLTAAFFVPGRPRAAVRPWSGTGGYGSVPCSAQPGGSCVRAR
jgi:hypothetical protein